MIEIGALVAVPGQGIAEVFAEHRIWVGVQMVWDRRLLWVETAEIHRADEPPSEEEVAYG